MSKILEQLNAEQERLEQEQLKNCCNDLLQSLKHDFVSTIDKNDLLRMKDMHDFIHSNPTLKGDMKELTYQRFVEIYKTNHPEQMKHQIDHDNNPDTPAILMEQAIDLLVESL